MEHNLPAYYWQWSSPAASTAGCEDSRFSPTPTQTSLLFPSFPSANRTQAALHYSEACPLVFYERVSQIFTTWCVHTGMQHLSWNILLTSGQSTWTKTGIWLHRGHLVHLDTILLFQIQRRKVFAQYGLWQSISVGLGISKASRKPLPVKPQCPSQHCIPLGKSSPLPFVSNLLCFLFPESAFWSFWIWTKPKSQLKSHSTLAASPYSVSLLGGTICSVCGFKPSISQVSHASLSTELSSQL